MYKKIISAFLLTLLYTGLQAQELDKNIKDRLVDFFKNYSNSTVNIGKCKLDSFTVNHSTRELNIYVDKRFAFQPFREENVQGIYRSIKQILPGPANYYATTIYTNGRTIDELIPNFYRSKKLDPHRTTEAVDDKSNPWVTNVSTPYDASRGLQNKHISLWQSHGRYYSNKLDKWLWQRPNLFCTTEDLFTQSFVTPFLIPMLENAGAIVYTPRERDTQRNEVIVDNDNPKNSIFFKDDKRKQRWRDNAAVGFANPKATYESGENPFTMGSSSIAPTKEKIKKAKSFAQWIPTIPKAGKYAVYVTYQTFDNSVSDAQYMVFHKGIITEFKVNQKIGSGTWVYLGTFEFDEGNSPENMVVLTNYSKENGVISADAVRFGGGMGNITRGGKTSSFARYLEGARYSTQWYGMPENIYSDRGRENDYADDMNARSNSLNYLAGSSRVIPHFEGLKVPLQLNVALHTDAGYKINDKIVGTLGIYTNEANTNYLGSGRDRISSRDLADIIQSDLKRDIQANFDIDWTRRSMWDSNYSETRLPNVPSVIIELLSHQNFADMRLGHDPYFKFTVSRSIYKSVLKYLSNQAKKDYVVQPLPVKNFSAEIKGKKAHLSWSETTDILEPTAQAREYVLYIKKDNGGFDNGTIVYSNSVSIDILPGVMYSFQVSAVNRGGKSFPSETLSVYKAPKEKKHVLIVNGFTRLSSPFVIDNEFDAGFDIDEDPGVSYMSDISMVGKQLNFRRADAKKTNGTGLGYSLSELEGSIIAGNTFNYPEIHGEAIKAFPQVSFSSSSMMSVESEKVSLANYDVVDFILGLQKRDNYNPANNKNFQLISPQMQGLIRNYTSQGGNIFISGSYLGSDLNINQQDKSFMNNILKFEYGSSILNRSISKVNGLKKELSIPRHLNEESYVINKPEELLPLGGAFAVMTYDLTNQSAGIAYKGNYNLFALGFPFESILNKNDRASIMSSILYFLLYDNK